MRDTDDSRREEPEPIAPQRLKEDLAALSRAGFPVPADVDDAVRAMARRHFSARKRVRHTVGWLAAAAAAAAVILAVLWTSPVLQRSISPSAMLQDIDRSGRVDILDAFALARLVENSTAPRREWDIDGDGVVGRRDVDAIAMTAVSLNKGDLQ